LIVDGYGAALVGGLMPSAIVMLAAFANVVCARHGAGANAATTTDTAAASRNKRKPRCIATCLPRTNGRPPTTLTADRTTHKHAVVASALGQTMEPRRAAAGSPTAASACSPSTRGAGDAFGLAQQRHRLGGVGKPIRRQRESARRRHAPCTA